MVAGTEFPGTNATSQELVAEVKRVSKLIPVKLQLLAQVSQSSLRASPAVGHY